MRALFRFFQPSAGSTGLTYVNDQLVTLELTAISYRLTCDATIAARLPYIERYRQDTLVNTIEAPATIAAGQSFFCLFARQSRDLIYSVSLTTPLPERFYLEPQDKLILAWLNNQAGDFLTNILIEFDVYSYASIQQLTAEQQLYII